MMASISGMTAELIRLRKEREKEMVASKMSLGLYLLPTLPLGLHRLLAYVARLSRLNVLWAVDRWQGPLAQADSQLLFSTDFAGQVSQGQATPEMHCVPSYAS